MKHTLEIVVDDVERSIAIERSGATAEIIRGLMHALEEIMVDSIKSDCAPEVIVAGLAEILLREIKERMAQK